VDGIVAADQAHASRQKDVAALSPTRTSAAPRPRVLEATAGQITFERGSADAYGQPDRAAVIAHWSANPSLSRSVVTLVREFSAAGYRPVLVSACESEEPLEWGGQAPVDVVVIRKPNLGYDFGSWTVALAELPAIAQARRVIFANDSMVGPFSPLAEILERFDAHSPDVFGLTDTRQYFRHLQSYFLGFADGVLAEEPLARFFDDVRVEATKDDVIHRYELGLSRLFRREGYGFTTAFRADDVVTAGENPVIRGWWRLLDQGFPFVKREILRNPAIAPNGDRVADEVNSLFGAQLAEWI
jgi:lipopolysaccharide biosynthesis protein